MLDLFYLAAGALGLVALWAIAKACDRVQGAAMFDDVKLIKAFNDEKAPLGFVAKTPIPAGAVTASASGLDPDISPRNAELQAARVAGARGVPLDQVRRLVAEHTEGRALGFLGELHVNVVELNLALDRQFGRK